MKTINGKGNITPMEDKPRAKCRKWRLRVSSGQRDFKTGRYKQYTRCVSGTYREAEAALRAFIDEIETRQVLGRSGVTFGEYVEAWLEKRKKEKAHGTWRRDVDRSNVLRLHLEKAKLEEITKEVIEETYQAILEGGTPSGRKPSGTYAHDIAITLQNILKYAVEDELIPFNPCSKVSPPAADTKEKKALSFDQMMALVNNLDPTNASQLAILLCVKTGMRRGEVCGLSWSDIDLNENAIRIQHAYDEGGNLKEPKTKAGIRTIPINDSVASDLRVRRCYLKNKFNRIQEKLGGTEPAFLPETPVICDALGNRQLPHSVTRWWDRNRAGFGLEGCTVHELRHSFLSEMARRRVDVKTLQVIAGHASFTTTMNIYTHVSLEDKREAMDAIKW